MVTHMKPTIWPKNGRSEPNKRITRRGLLTAFVLGVLTISTVLVAGRVAQARAATIDADKADKADAAKKGQGEISTANVRTTETEVGNLLADAVRAVAGAEIGLIPAFAFKTGATAPKPASVEQAINLVDPPNDTVVLLNLTGRQIKAALERSVSYAPQPSAGFLQVSGLKFTFDPRKDSPNRVSNIQVNGQPLDDNKTYKVAATKPLGNGQQGYHQVWDRKSIVTDTGKTLTDALTELAKRGPLSGAIENRITQAGR
jgi:2',3'-cyclic-nucleotide 2'-phosphodiesterase (5'-nucleotidase family)